MCELNIQLAKIAIGCSQASAKKKLRKNGAGNSTLRGKKKTLVTVWFYLGLGDYEILKCYQKDWKI